MVSLSLKTSFGKLVSENLNFLHYRLKPILIPTRPRPVVRLEVEWVADPSLTVPKVVARGAPLAPEEEVGVVGSTLRLMPQAAFWANQRPRRPPPRLTWEPLSLAGLDSAPQTPSDSKTAVSSLGVCKKFVE